MAFILGSVNLGQSLQLGSIGGSIGGGSILEEAELAERERSSELSPLTGLVAGSLASPLDSLNSAWSSLLGGGNVESSLLGPSSEESSLERLLEGGGGEISLLGGTGGNLEAYSPLNALTSQISSLEGQNVNSFGDPMAGTLLNLEANPNAELGLELSTEESSAVGPYSGLQPNTLLGQTAIPIGEISALSGDLGGI